MVFIVNRSVVPSKRRKDMSTQSSGHGTRREKQPLETGFRIEMISSLLNNRTRIEEGRQSLSTRLMGSHALSPQVPLPLREIELELYRQPLDH